MEELQFLLTKPWLALLPVVPVAAAAWLFWMMRRLFRRAPAELDLDQP